MHNSDVHDYCMIYAIITHTSRKNETKQGKKVKRRLDGSH